MKGRLKMENTHKYESIIILKKDYTEQEKHELIEQVKEITMNCEVQELGMKRLAYEIRGNKEGYYMQFNFEQTEKAIARLEKIFKASEIVIKFIVVREED
jgi:small subunit ribosomal protein S6